MKKYMSRNYYKMDNGKVYCLEIDMRSDTAKIINTKKEIVFKSQINKIQDVMNALEHINKKKVD